MAEVFDYTKTNRFGVIRKLPKYDRYRCNFKYLHDSLESAEKEALRLTEKYKAKFYIVEIQKITNGPDTESPVVASQEPEKAEATEEMIMTPDTCGACGWIHHLHAPDCGKLSEFTFHVPYTQHDEYKVQAANIEDARESLWIGIQTGNLQPTERAITDVSDTDYDDISGCNAFDVFGNEI